MAASKEGRKLERRRTKSRSIQYIYINVTPGVRWDCLGNKDTDHITVKEGGLEIRGSSVLTFQPRLLIVFTPYKCFISRSQWPRGLRRRSAAARLLRLWVRIPSGAWMFVCCECCVLSGRGLCDELITRSEDVR